MGASQCQRIVCRGTPQGGVLSPLLWNLAANSLLRRLESSGNNVINYADDIAITAEGISPQTLFNKLNLALSIVLNWCGIFGLSVNPSKQDRIIFIRRYKAPAFTLPSINWTRLTLSTEVKFWA